MESGIFFARRLDEWNRAERLEDFSIFAQAVLAAIGHNERGADRAICLTGKSISAPVAVDRARVFSSSRP
jgi:hypothetical protein